MRYYFNKTLLKRTHVVLHFSVYLIFTLARASKKDEIKSEFLRFKYKLSVISKRPFLFSIKFICIRFFFSSSRLRIARIQRVSCSHSTSGFVLYVGAGWRSYRIIRPTRQIFDSLCTLRLSARAAYADFRGTYYELFMLWKRFRPKQKRMEGKKIRKKKNDTQYEKNRFGNRPRCDWPTGRADCLPGLWVRRHYYYYFFFFNDLVSISSYIFVVVYNASE